MYGKLKSKLTDGNGIAIIAAVGLAVAVLMSAVPAAAFTGIAASWDSNEAQPKITINNGGTSSFTVDTIAVNGNTSDSLSVSVEASSSIDVYLGQGTNDSANDVYYANLSDDQIPVQSDNVVVTRGDGSTNTYTYDISPTVSGTVYNDANERLQGATVSVGNQEVTTASDGTYSANLTGITVADIDSVDVVVDDSAHYSNTQTVAVTPDSATTVDAFLSGLETVEVTVDEEVETTTDGETTLDLQSVQNATVGIYNVDTDQDGNDVRGSLVQETTTDSEGLASVDVEAGDYYVVVDHADQYVTSDQNTEYSQLEQKISVADGGSADATFALDGSADLVYSEGDSSGDFIGGVGGGDSFNDTATVISIAAGGLFLVTFLFGVFGWLLREAGR